MQCSAVQGSGTCIGSKLQHYGPSCTLVHLNHEAMRTDNRMLPLIPLKPVQHPLVLFPRSPHGYQLLHCLLSSLR